MKKLLLVLTLCILSGCTSIPEGITPVKGFELDRYLGTWYEIARLDHRFERGLEQISATYSVREDGGVDVLNRGLNTETLQWDEANGKAYFVDASDTGHLKVSFFGPFYASYVIFALDHEDYQYALVTGPDREYFWILSRSKQMSKRQLDKLVQLAKEYGFATKDLIYVEHS